MTDILIVEREGCVDCANANDLFARLQREGVSLNVRHVKSDEPVGRRIIEEIAAVEVPIVLVAGHYFAQGAIDEGKLRQRIAQAGQPDGERAGAAHADSAQPSAASSHAEQPVRAAGATDAHAARAHDCDCEAA